MIKRLFSNFAINCILFVSALSIWLAGNHGAFGLNKIRFDIVMYHSYLPATFIKKDLSLSFYKDSTDYYFKKGHYWANFTEEGSPVIKTTYGLSLMYFPFTAWPLLFNSNEHLDGYELPFSIAISVSTLFYYILGLFILYKALKLLQYSNRAIGFTILVLGLGTNLLAYVYLALGMPHAYDFFLISSLLYISLRWHEKPSFKFSLLAGLVIGLIIAIRPSNLLFALCFLLMQKSDKRFYSLQFYLKNFKLLLLTGILAFLVVLPQLLYWKYATGHYLYNSYVGEHFYFNHPHLIQYLFGFRKGWFIYSPLIIAGLAGLFISRKTNPFFIVSLIVIALMIYLNSSWWCWWFGGGYGARSMIEAYPLIAIGFAALFERLLSHKRKAAFISATCFLILFNIKSVDLYRSNIIHYDGMTREAFFRTTFKLFFSEEEKKSMERLYKRPDYDKALKGIDT